MTHSLTKRSAFFAMVLAIAAFTFYSCQPTEVIEETLTEEERLQQEIQAYVDAYLEKHGGPPAVKRPSLAELNEAFAKYGLPPATAESLGFTEEQFEALKNQPPGQLDERYYCNEYNFVILIDVNGDRIADVEDIALAQRAAAQDIIPQDRQMRSFAYISYYCSRVEGEKFDRLDFTNASDYVFNQICCD